MRKLIPDHSEAAEPVAGGPSHTEMKIFAGLLLARREYAVLELQARLLKKWAGQEDMQPRVAALVATLQEEGALSDERFAASFIRARCLRHNGPLKIQAELRQRQVPEHTIESQLQNPEEEWVSLAASWLSRQHSGTLDFAGRAKYYRRLMNRGFSHQQAMAALQGFSER
jgi:regulatory protein